jgi:hypothetical protein
MKDFLGQILAEGDHVIVIGSNPMIGTIVQFTDKMIVIERLKRPVKRWHYARELVKITPEQLVWHLTTQ